MAEVISVPRQPDGHPYFRSTPSLRRSSPSQSSLLAASPRSYSPSSSPQPRLQAAEHTERISLTPPVCPPSPPQSSPTEISHSSSFTSTPASSISSSVTASEEDDLSFPSYNDDASFTSSEEEPSFSPNTASDETLADSQKARRASSSQPPAIPLTAVDDTAAQIEPTRHVDYLSHDWQEEDIWSSWRHIVSKRRVYGEQSRLENASWRTWAKSKYGLRTVSPETLNW